MPSDLFGDFERANGFKMASNMFPGVFYNDFVSQLMFYIVMLNMNLFY